MRLTNEPRSCVAFLASDADIDHLVIGPGGRFTINAKHHSGMTVWVDGNTYMVNGVRQPPIRN